MIEVKKAEAARLADLLDDPPSLADALRDVLRSVVVGRGSVAGDSDDVFALAGELGGWAPDRTSAVSALEPEALVQLAIDLCELRTLEVDG